MAMLLIYSTQIRGLAQIRDRNSHPLLRAVLVLIATPPGKTESR
jgi:hypothetical protein